MMYSYPFFSFPHFRRFDSRYYPASYSYVRQPIRDVTKSRGRNELKNDMYLSSQQINSSKKGNSSTQMKNTASKSKEKSSPKRTFSGFSFLNNFLHQEDRSADEDFFDLFGLKLYHDDLLLLGLIFFLYQEDVKDEYLFFALVLLLLS